MDYSNYCLLVKEVFGEELERMEEFLYSIKNNYDCSGDKPWIDEPFADIPSRREMIQIMLNFEGVDINNLTDEQVDDIRAVWYTF